jgi:geranylgeranyl pyrophosphate synthase
MSQGGIEEYFFQKKPVIQKRLAEIFESARTDFGERAFWAKDVICRLAVFSAEGKMVRGSLVLLGTELEGGGIVPEAVDVAAAMEIIHAALLVHDDIMDNDWQRRGKPTVFAQYFKVAKTKKCANPLEAAKSLAICAGDFGFFLGMKTIGASDLDHDVKLRLVSELGREIAATALAQADDVLFGAQGKSPSPKQIETVYNNKTARYTISLPLILGALTAGAGGEVISGLEKYGLPTGVIFQLRDDYLGLMVDRNKTTKHIGSDIIENKKTVIRWFLYDLANGKQKKVLDGIFGRKDIGAKEVETVKGLVRALKIEEKIIRIQDEKIAQAEMIIEAMSIDPLAKELLTGLVDFVALRNN